MHVNMLDLVRQGEAAQDERDRKALQRKQEKKRKKKKHKKKHKRKRSKKAIDNSDGNIDNLTYAKYVL